MSEQWLDIPPEVRARAGVDAPAQTVIVVAPRNVVLRIACLVSDLEVVGFGDLQDLDRWRRGDLVLSQTIRSDVEAALAELGRNVHMLSPRIRAVLESVSRHRSVPSATELERGFGSRRSLYRAWAAEIPVAPGAFLRRVRTIRAERLISGGATQKEAAIRAGFGSVDRLRRLIRQRRARR